MRYFDSSAPGAVKGQSHRRVVGCRSLAFAKYGDVPSPGNGRTVAITSNGAAVLAAEASADRPYPKVTATA
jgi:hypothetical protein